MPLDAKDKIEIQELSSKYANAMDNDDVESWLATWSSSGSWTGGLGTYVGTERLRELFCDLGNRIRGKRHVMTNFVIEGDEVSAKQCCYMLIADIAKSGPPGTAVYTDELKKIDGRWRFIERKVVIDQLVAPT